MYEARARWLLNVEAPTKYYEVGKKEIETKHDVCEGEIYWWDVR